MQPIHGATSVNLLEDNADGLYLQIIRPDLLGGPVLLGGLQHTASTFADDARVILDSPDDMADWGLDGDASADGLTAVARAERDPMTPGWLRLCALTGDPGFAAMHYCDAAVDWDRSGDAATDGSPGAASPLEIARDALRITAASPDAEACLRYASVAALVSIAESLEALVGRPA